MTKMRVLISDPMSSQAINVFEERGIEVVQTGKMKLHRKPVLMLTISGMHWLI